MVLVEVDGGDHPGLGGASGVDDTEAVSVAAGPFDGVARAGPVVSASFGDEGAGGEDVADFLEVDGAAGHAAFAVAGELEGAAEHLGLDRWGRGRGGAGEKQEEGEHGLGAGV